MKFTADFLYEEGTPQTLLLVYYAGHGSPRAFSYGHHGLSLSLGRCPPHLTFIQFIVYSKRGLSEIPEELNEIVWGRIEANFQRTKGRCPRNIRLVGTRFPHKSGLEELNVYLADMLAT